MEGRSLAPLLAGEGDETWRSWLLLEAYDFEGDELIYVGVRDDRYLYVETLEQVERTVETTRLKAQTINLKTQWVELYDMQTDPYQMQNRAGDPAYRQVENRLRRQLWREVTRNELSPRSDKRLGYYEWAALGGGAALGLAALAAAILITRRVTLRQMAGRTSGGPTA
jgi:hypothetical protein